jgi:hypothetical protein
MMRWAGAFCPGSEEDTPDIAQELRVLAPPTALEVNASEPVML